MNLKDKVTLMSNLENYIECCRALMDLLQTTICQKVLEDKDQLIYEILRKKQEMTSFFDEVEQLESVSHAFIIEINNTISKINTLTTRIFDRIEEHLPVINSDVYDFDRHDFRNALEKHLDIRHSMEKTCVEHDALCKRLRDKPVVESPFSRESSNCKLS